MQAIKPVVTFGILLLVLSACIEPFTPDIGEGKQYMVIMGSVTDEEGYQYAEISRASSYSDQDFLPVNGCEALIIDGQGNTFSMENYSDGRYRTWIDQEYLQTGERFKLEVVAGGKSYESDFDTLLPCPDIDSIYYEHIDILQDDPDRPSIHGLQFYIDYDATGDYAENYRWELTETWEYHAEELIWAVYFGVDTLCAPFVLDIPLDAFHRLVDDTCMSWISVLFLNKFGDKPIDSLYACWKTKQIKDLFSYTLHQRADKKVTGMPLNQVTNKDNKLGIKYSLLVKQYSLSDLAFKFWNHLQLQATETGGLYETQPYQLEGNIKCTDNEEEQVIGYFNATSVKEKRFTYPFLFGKYHTDCKEVISDFDSLTTFLWGEYPEQPSVPLYLYKVENRTDTFLYLDQSCFDCRLLGGTTTKPEYWD